MVGSTLAWPDAGSGDCAHRAPADRV